VDLGAHALAVIPIHLEQGSLLLLESAVLLLDAEDLTGVIEHHEVDLPVQGLALVLASPVDPVKNRVVVG